MIQNDLVSRKPISLTIFSHTFQHHVLSSGNNRYHKSKFWRLKKKLLGESTQCLSGGWYCHKLIKMRIFPVDLNSISVWKNVKKLCLSMIYLHIYFHHIGICHTYVDVFISSKSMHKRKKKNEELTAWGDD